MIKISSILEKKKHQLMFFLIFLFVGSFMIFYSLASETTPHLDNDKLSVVVINLSKVKATFLIIGLFILITTVLLFIKYYKPKKQSDIFSKLTVTERRVVSLIKNGKINKEIAEELNISLSTVKTHINSIYKKLDISTRSDLIKSLNQQL